MLALARHGIDSADVTTLPRLLYAGRRSMGALEFEPALRDGSDEAVAEPLAMAQLVEDARRVLRGELDVVAKDIIAVGSSAGGARAKALIGWHAKTQPRSSESQGFTLFENDRNIPEAVSLAGPTDEGLPRKHRLN